MLQIFVSHTKKDEKFCDEFDRICSSVGIKRFRSELEEIERPAWKTIKDAINNSNAVFFLVGKELIKSQDSVDPGWRHTQNWIAYEIGLACQKGIDVWAVCDNVPINFPLPYINNYFIHGLNNEAFKAFKTILEFYRNGSNFPVGWQDNKYFVKCPNNDCKMEFNLMGGLQPKSIIKCPQCLKEMVFPNGFLYRTPDIADLFA